MVLSAAGGVPPGNLDIQRMIDAAAECGGGMVRVPSGEWEVKPFDLKSNVTLELAEGARLLASTNIADYATDGECPVFIFTALKRMRRILSGKLTAASGSILREGRSPLRPYRGAS